MLHWKLKHTTDLKIQMLMNVMEMKEQRSNNSNYSMLQSGQGQYEVLERIILWIKGC